LGYLSQTRGRLILVSFIACSAILAAFPQIDLSVSRWFYSGGFPFADSPLHGTIRDLTTGFLWLSFAAVIAAYLINKSRNQRMGGVDGKRVCFLFLVLALGAGLIVNLGFKDHFGRARPRDVSEFGGGRTFTAAFAIGSECRKNCSFSSGEAAAGFFSLALVYALARRRRFAIGLAVAFGATVSLARIAAGAHFLSDTLVSFFIMLMLSDALHYYMRLEPLPEISTPLLRAAPIHGAAASSRAPTG
jgi:lipid A 4'-phosphatase